MSPKRILIAAVSDNNVIGYQNQIPWRGQTPEDMEHFRSLTLCYPVIMGRKTHESIGGPLDNRMNFVVTRNGNVSRELPGRLRFYHSVEEALEEAYTINEFYNDCKGLAKSDFQPKIFFVGRGEIYREALEKGLVDRMEITRVHRHVPGDTFFPKINWSEWIKTDYNELDGLSFNTYEKAA